MRKEVQTAAGPVPITPLTCTQCGWDTADFYGWTDTDDRLCYGCALSAGHPEAMRKQAKALEEAMWNQAKKNWLAGVWP